MRRSRVRFPEAAPIKTAGHGATARRGHWHHRSNDRKMSPKCPRSCLRPATSSHQEGAHKDPSSSSRWRGQAPAERPWGPRHKPTKSMLPCGEDRERGASALLLPPVPRASPLIASNWILGADRPLVPGTSTRRPADPPPTDQRSAPGPARAAPSGPPVGLETIHVQLSEWLPISSTSAGHTIPTVHRGRPGPGQTRSHRPGLIDTRENFQSLLKGARSARAGPRRRRALT